MNLVNEGVVDAAATAPASNNKCSANGSAARDTARGEYGATAVTFALVQQSRVKP